jgi:large subunit ribosomal protein L6e
MPDSTVGQTKQFGKGQRTVPKPEQKAQKWYPVDEDPQPKKVSTMLPELRVELRFL